MPVAASKPESVSGAVYSAQLYTLTSLFWAATDTDAAHSVRPTTERKPMLNFICQSPGQKRKKVEDSNRNRRLETHDARQFLVTAIELVPPADACRTGHLGQRTPQPQKVGAASLW